MAQRQRDEARLALIGSSPQPRFADEAAEIRARLDVVADVT
jgi:hypothetical protein